MKLFLISSSRSSKAGGGFWNHCIDSMGKFLGPPKGRVLFISLAHPDRDYVGYAKTVGEQFAKIGYELVDINTYAKPTDCFYDDSIVAVCIGGGNTWLLNFLLYKLHLLDGIRNKVTTGEWMYISASAGTVEAGVSMISTNDMCPIMTPADPKALNLVPFLINPHFVAGPLVDGHMGETREERIRQVLVWNKNLEVVALTEGNWIEVIDESYILRGTGEGIIFRKDGDTTILLPDEEFLYAEKQ